MLTARCQHRERVGDLLIELLIRALAAIDLVEHLAVLDEQHARGVAGRLDRVRDHEDGLTAAVDILKQAQQLIRRARIERAGRLVGKHELRLRDERAGDGHALLLAAGELIRELLQQLGNAKLPGDGRKARGHLRIRLAGEHERQENVILHGERIEQVELLKHEAELRAAEGRDLPLGDGAQRPAVEHDLATGGLIERGEDVKQRGLTAAALAHDGDVLALLDREIHIAERLHLRAAEACGVNLLNVTNFQKRHNRYLLCNDRLSINRRENGCHTSGLHFPGGNLRFCKAHSTSSASCSSPMRTVVPTPGVETMVIE